MKTNCDILGIDTANVIVDGRYISRREGRDQYRVLMDCQTHEMALRVLEAWHTECESRQLQSRLKMLDRKVGSELSLPERLRP